MSTQYFRFSTRHSGEAVRSDLLERMLARSDAWTAVVDWRADAFGTIARGGSEMPGLSAAALYSAVGEVSEPWVFFATPVVYVVEMSNVRMSADAPATVDPAEAAALASEFNRVWHDAGMRLLVDNLARLFCVVDRPVWAQTRDPAEALGHYLEGYLPTGPDGHVLRQLMSEIEMWLFDHAVNRERSKRGAPVLGGLWMWGGGATLTSPPAVLGWSAGSDPFFSSIASVASIAAQGDAGCGVIVVAESPGTAAWSGVEQRWMEPALQQLRAGRLSSIRLSAGDRACELTAGGWRRFWRRRRPWWTYFA